MKWKKILLGTGAGLGLVALGGAAWAYSQAAACDASMKKAYDVPLPAIQRSMDPAVIARGKHLVESVTACASSDCHGSDLGGGRTLAMGPLGHLTGPNISPGGARAREYSDGELARLVRHGIRRDGTSVRFMPSHEIGWVPDPDLTAIVSYVRSVAPVQKSDGPMEIGLLAKILDRREQFVLDVARRIDHASVGRELGSSPAPTAAYGEHLARGCKGCHGEHLSGGPIPGAPPSIPTPKNITPHATGLGSWKYEDFDRLLTTGVNPSGAKLNPFMPYEALSKLDEVERRALWAYLQGVPPLEAGKR